MTEPKLWQPGQSIGNRPEPPPKPYVRANCIVLGCPRTISPDVINGRCRPHGGRIA